MKKTIYYFSGTGNSLYVAKKIQEQLERKDSVWTGLLTSGCPETTTRNHYRHPEINITELMRE